MRGLVILELDEEVDQVLRVREEFIEFVDHQFLDEFGRDGFGSAGLFDLGGGTLIAAIVLPVGLGTGKPVHDGSTTGTFEQTREEIGAGFAARMIHPAGDVFAFGVLFHEELHLFKYVARDGGFAVVFDEQVTIFQRANIDGVAEEGDV